MENLSTLKSPASSNTLAEKLAVKRPGAAVVSEIFTGNET
jgi:hypothetical protein